MIMTKRFIPLWIVLVLLLPVHPCAAADNCVKLSPREYVFGAGPEAKVLLRFCSPSIVRVEYAFDGQFTKESPTPAVINDNIADVNILLEEDGRAYDIHTGALRLVVESEPFCIKVYDNYQTMLVSDIPGGYVKDGDRIICTKNFARNESIFGLGEKGDVLERRGGVYTMWKTLCTRVSRSS